MGIRFDGVNGVSAFGVESGVLSVSKDVDSKPVGAIFRVSEDDSEAGRVVNISREDAISIRDYLTRLIETTRE